MGVRGNQYFPGRRPDARTQLKDHRTLTERIGLLASTDGHAQTDRRTLADFRGLVR